MIIKNKFFVKNDVNVNNNIITVEISINSSLNINNKY